MDPVVADFDENEVTSCHEMDLQKAKEEGQAFARMEDRFTRALQSYTCEEYTLNLELHRLSEANREKKENVERLKGLAARMQNMLHEQTLQNLNMQEDLLKVNREILALNNQLQEIRKNREDTEYNKLLQEELELKMELAGMMSEVDDNIPRAASLNPPLCYSETDKCN